MDKSIAPATGIPAEKGLMIEDIKEMLELCSKHSSFSFDLAEVNPKKEGSEKTIRTAQTIINIMLN